MIVLDASALVELLLATAVGKSVAARIADPDESLHIPHLADIETMQVLRRYFRQGDIDAQTAALAMDNLHDLDLQRHAHEPYLSRIWELRENLAAYDAVYVALAEVLDCVLLTGDARLSRAAGIRCKIEVVRAGAGS